MKESTETTRPVLDVHMVCHTHWDREWYLTRMQFRTKLVRLMDNLLALPDGASFMLDGQTIALEDYLEIRPENKEKLTEAVRSGKIIIGPWYILPDEMLISGESHIRNYLIGDYIASQYGPKMQIGYLPDSFGHPQQMPQILKGLGLDTIIFWRGASNEMDKTEFFWEAADGSKVLCVHLPFGYGTAAKLGTDIGEIVPRLNEMTDKLKALSNTKVVLLMNGSDHLLNEAGISETINKFNGFASGKNIRLSTLQNFLDHLKVELPENLKSYAGPLCFGDRTLLLGGTLSTRMYLKQRNHLVQKRMERYVEPISAYERITGGSFNTTGYRRRLWQLILENHPHDSICGCSVDPVHSEMMKRFDSVLQLENQVISDGFHRFQSALQKNAKAFSTGADGQVFIFEPTQDCLPTYVELDVNLDVSLQKQVNFSKSIIEEVNTAIPQPPKGLAVYDENGQRLESVLISAQQSEYYHFSDDNLPVVYNTNRCRLGVLLPGMSYGMHLINIRKDEAQSFAETGEFIENEFYCVSFSTEEASFVVTDKSCGRVHRGVNKFIDKGDAGDEYTYSWPETDEEFSLSFENILNLTTSITPVKSSITFNAELSLPERLSDDRRRRVPDKATSYVEVTLSLYKGIDRLDFQTSIVNNSKDHRLQVQFPAGVLCRTSSASTAFTVTENLVEKPVPESWEEYPQAALLTHGFIDVSDNAYGIGLSTNGLPEYEVVNKDQSFVNVTLLRCVGWLSRADLLTRKGNGGWSMETPQAQCMGPHSFEYSVTYHEGSWKNSQAYQMADRALHQPEVYQLAPWVCGIEPPDNPLSFVSNLPPLVRLSALKPCESRDTIILRVFNISDMEITFDLQLSGTAKELYENSLSEERIKQIPINEGKAAVTIGLGQILTLELCV